MPPCGTPERSKDKMKTIPMADGDHEVSKDRQKELVINYADGVREINQVQDSEICVLRTILMSHAQQGSSMYV